MNRLFATTSLALLACSLPATAHGAEKRIVTYVDGPKPHFEASGDRFVRGPMLLELEFRGTNPLCYQYTSSVTPLNGRALPSHGAARAGESVLTPVAPASFSNADEALTALRAANDALERAAHDAREKAALDAAWSACASGGNLAAQRARVDAAAAALAANLAPGGGWRQALTQAGAAARGALDFAGPLADAAATDADARARQAAVERAEAEVARARDAVDRAQKTRKPVPEELQRALDTASADLEAARRAAEEGDKVVAQHRAAPHVVATAERLTQRRRKLGELLDRLNADVAHAQALLAAAPVRVSRTFAAGESVTVAVVRKPLVRGRAVATATAETFTAAEYETLDPIILDIGFGPAVTLGQNSEEYDLTVVNSSGGGSRLAAARTEKELIMDGMVSFSAYIWGRRYLDDTVFDAQQLIPRPMIGLSMEQPFTSVYAGLQIDPIQFVDISGGVRWLSTKNIVGQKVDPDDPTRPGEPQTRDEVTPLYFAAITFSTDLFWRWAKRQIKDIAD